MEINGVAHIILTTGDFPRARAFYSKLLPFLGLKPVRDIENFYYYCVGGRTAVGIRPGAPAGERFSQDRVGLHHACFRVRERAEVDEVHAFLLTLEGAVIVHGPQEDGWAPGYYSVLFEDPDGVRLEVNHVPGRGLLADSPESKAALAW